MDSGAVHSVTVFVRLALASSGAASKVRVMEPNKCHEWRWCSPSEAPPQPMFPPLEHLMNSDYWCAEFKQQKEKPRLPMNRITRKKRYSMSGGQVAAAAVAGFLLGALAVRVRS